MNYETFTASLEDRWFGIASSSLRRSATSSSDLQNSNPEHVVETLHASPSAPNLRQRSTLKTGHLRRKPMTGEALNATEKLPRAHFHRASTSFVDLSQHDGTLNAPAATQPPINGTATQAPPPLQGLGRPPRPDAPSRSSARTLLKTQNTKDYAERRKAWRARLEATMAAPRLYTATVPVPSAARSTGSRAASVQSTPSGSPKPQSPLSKADADDGDYPTQPHPAVPAVWVGHSSDRAPDDFSALDDEALKRFLQQAGSSIAGSPPPTGAAATSREELVAAARSSKGAWEVERIVVGCSLPEHVLRIQKNDWKDPLLLKAAWKKLAFQVHPDRCSADGASIAMAIAKDAYDILAWRAERYQATAEVDRNLSKTHTTTHAAAQTTGTVAGINSSFKGGVADIDGNDVAKPLRPLSAPSEMIAGGVHGGPSGLMPQQPPLKVRVKLKVKVKK